MAGESKVGFVGQFVTARLRGAEGCRQGWVISDDPLRIRGESGTEYDCEGIPVVVLNPPSKKSKIIRFVVCAAIRRNGVIVTGARHFDSIMRNIVARLAATHDGWEQGFIDQFDVFMTREEAWEVADKAGQIRRETGWEQGDEIVPRQAGVGDKGQLFSENLY